MALTRAIMQDSTILLLDEPTPFLDINTERELYRSLLSLAPRPAMMIATHRLSITKVVDRIYVLHKGRIVEQGTHDELMVLAREYYRLYQKQGAVEVADKKTSTG